MLTRTKATLGEALGSFLLSLRAAGEQKRALNLHRQHSLLEALS